METVRNTSCKWGRCGARTANGDEGSKLRKWGRREVTNQTLQHRYLQQLCTAVNLTAKKTEILRTVRRISAPSWKKFPASLLVIRRYRFLDQLVHAFVNPAELLLVFSRKLRFFVEYEIQLGEAFFYCGHVPGHDAPAFGRTLLTPSTRQVIRNEVFDSGLQILRNPNIRF